MQDQVQTVTINDQEYKIEDLSNEVKELLSLHAQAQEMMVAARRQAAIHELAVSNLSNLIASRVQADKQEPEPLPAASNG